MVADCNCIKFRNAWVYWHKGIIYFNWSNIPSWKKCFEWWAGYNLLEGSRILPKSGPGIASVRRVRMDDEERKNPSLFPSCSAVKNLPARQETRTQSLGQEDPLEEVMATHSSILAWKIPWTEEPGGLQSVGPHRVRHDWVTKKQNKLPRNKGI